MSRTLSQVPALVCVSVLTFMVLSCDAGGFVEPGEPGDGSTVREPASLQLESLAELVTEDDTVTVRAVLLDGDGQPILDVTPVWITSDERIASIQDASGAEAMLVAKQPGSTTLSVTYEGLSASTEVEVYNRPVDLIYVSGSDQEAFAGATLSDSLVVRAVDRRGDAVSGVSIRYSVTLGGGSVAPSTGLTDVNGYVRSEWTLGSAGPQSAEARGSESQTRVKNLKDSVVVFTARIPPTLQSLEVSPSSATLEEGDTLQLDVDGTASDGSRLDDPQVSWESTDTLVVTVSSSGLVTARDGGQSMITASSEGVSGTATVVVLSAAGDPGRVTDLEVDSVHADAVKLRWTQVDDGTGTAADYALRYGSPSIAWSDASATEATVSGTAPGEEIAYTFTGLSPSSEYEFQVVGFRVTLDQDTILGELSETRSATTHQQQVVRASVAPTSHVFTRVGETAPITATGFDSLGNVVENAEFTFTSSDSAIVSVDAMGIMTARALGTASILVAAVCCDVAAPVEAEVTFETTATYFVSTTGSNASAGTESAPWKTIGYALTQLEPGQTLYVRGGEYEENITNPGIRSGRPDERIRVAAYPGERPVLRGLLWLNRPSYWTIDGLNVTWSPTNAATDHMVKMTNGVGWVFENAELWGARSFAGLLVYGSISGEPADWTIRGNCVYDVWTDPIHHVNGDHNLYINTGTSAGAGLIERNILFNAPNGQNVKLGYGSSEPQPGHGTANVTVRYNTMYGALKNLMVTDESHHNVIERNIIQGSAEGYALRAYRLSGSDNVIRDNVLNEMRSLQYGDPGYGLVTDGGGNLLPHDPRFDSIGCSGFRPADETASAFGRYAP